MNDHILASVLRVVDENGPVPQAFEDELWQSLEAESARANWQKPREHGRRNTPSPRILVGVALAAAVVIGVVVFAAAFLAQNDPPVITDDIPDTTIVATTAAPTTTAAVDDELSAPPAGFTGPVQISGIGNTFVAVRFGSATESEFTAVVSSGDVVLDKLIGTAMAGELTAIALENLEAGMLYTVEITLAGPPVVVSDPVEFRTAGTAEAETEPVEILDLRLGAVESKQFQFDYETNICANGSFVIVDADGTEVGRNDGQAEGCTNQHLGVPGMWTPPLEPDSEYTVTVTAEANGAGLGDGNVATDSLTVRTLPVE